MFARNNLGFGYPVGNSLGLLITNKVLATVGTPHTTATTHLEISRRLAASHTSLSSHTSYERFHSCQHPLEFPQEEYISLLSIHIGRISLYRQDGSLGALVASHQAHSMHIDD